MCSHCSVSELAMMNSLRIRTPIAEVKPVSHLGQIGPVIPMFFLARRQGLGQVIVGSGDSFQVWVPHASRVLNFVGLYGGKVAND